jgi:hypothetical protein
MSGEPNTPVTIPAEKLNKLLDGWALAIGRFLVVFTSCEYWTYLYIRTFGSERVREAAGGMNLGPRAELAHALVSDIGLNEETQKRVDAAFDTLKRLATKRNLVAHNGPMVQIYKNATSGALEIRHELRSAKDPAKDITIEELERLHGDAVKLDEELALLYGLVRQPESHIKR